MERQTTLTYKDGTSDKWWRIIQSDSTIETSWGRTGSKGQRKIANYGNENAASTEYWRLVGAKKRKGYIESASTSVAPTQEVVDEAADNLRKLLAAL